MGSKNGFAYEKDDRGVVSATGAIAPVDFEKEANEANIAPVNQDSITILAPMD